MPVKLCYPNFVWLVFFIYPVVRSDRPVEYDTQPNLTTHCRTDWGWESEWDNELTMYGERENKEEMESWSMYVRGPRA